MSQFRSGVPAPLRILWRLTRGNQQPYHSQATGGWLLLAWLEGQSGRVLLEGGCEFVSSRRRRKQLVDEEVFQPLLVPLGGPASVTDEQPVELG
jgi:hypothetical protein